MFVKYLPTVIEPVHCLKPDYAWQNLIFSQTNDVSCFYTTFLYFKSNPSMLNIDWICKSPSLLSENNQYL